MKKILGGLLIVSALNTPAQTIQTNLGPSENALAASNYHKFVHYPANASDDPSSLQAWVGIVSKIITSQN